MLRETGARLAKGTAEGTRYVRATVCLTHVASPKPVSPLATVRSLGPFFTILEGRISLVAVTSDCQGHQSHNQPRGRS